jgi:hypothetical protein
MRALPSPRNITSTSIRGRQKELLLGVSPYVKSCASEARTENNDF